MDEGLDEPKAAAPAPEIDVVRAGEGRWRVVDRTRTSTDERHLLGCIELHDACFEVRLIGARTTWTRFTSWNDAIEQVVTNGVALAEERVRLGIRWRM